MAECNADRIGRIRSELPLEPEQRPHHQLHLFLLGPALPDDCELHLARRVFEYRRIRGEGRAQRRAAGLAELEGAVGITVHEYPLDGHLGGSVLPHQHEHAFENLPEARRKVAAGRADGAARHVTGIAVDPVDHAKAGGLRSRIEAQDTHALSAHHDASTRRKRPAPATTTEPGQILTPQVS